MKYIDKFLDSITMYKLLIYTLFGLAFYSLALSLLGFLYYSPLALVASFFTLTIVSYFTHAVFQKIFRAPASAESTPITALIIFFIVEPSLHINNLLWICIIAFASVATKYIFVWKSRHIFNPAALSVLIAGLFQFGGAVWWVGTVQMLPLVIIAGLLIVKKIRRFDLFWAYIITSTTAALMFKMMNAETMFGALSQHFISWPTIFFATFMLTEPLSTPPTRNLRIFYGVVAGFLSSLPFNIGFVNSSPELALVISNIITFIFGMRSRLTLRLKEKIELAKDTYEFVFTKNHAFEFKPGQYIEWTLPSDHQDNRGTRRYFTISSAPHEKDVSIGVRFGENISTFKQDLLKLNPGDKLYATSLAGDFTLHSDKNLVFIAGGIGITPFISMIRDAMKHERKLDAVLFYANKDDNIPYKDVLSQAEQKIGIKVVYLKDFLTADIIKNNCKNTEEITYYLSGPHGMVEAYKTLLHDMKIPGHQIKTDYFPGFA